MPIDAVFLDTNCLYGENWIAPSAALTQALEFAQSLGVPVFVPELVLAEVHQVFNREIGDSLSKVANLYSHKIASKLQSGTVPPLALPDRKTLVDAYNKQSAETLKKYSISVIPTADISLKDALSQSVSHATPFRESDSGFRDSMILMSCAEYAKACGFKDAILVANDDGMKSGAGYLATHNIRIVPSAKDVGDLLKRDLGEEVGRRYQERQDDVLNALKTHLNEITEFLTTNVEIPERLDGVVETVVKVHRIVAEDVASVITGFAAVPVEDRDVTGGAEIKAKIVADMQPNMFSSGYLPSERIELGPSVRREIEAEFTLDFVVKRVDGVLQFKFKAAELGKLDDALTRVLVKNTIRASIVKPRVGGHFPK